MVNQKLISFKVDTTQLELLDSILPDLGCNRNKFINKCLSFALGAVITQLYVAKRQHKDTKLIPFMS